MGRSVSSIRREVKEMADRWTRTRKALKREDQPYAEELAKMAKMHSNEVFYLFDDPLEAAMFSLLLEMLKKIDGLKESNTDSDSGLIY
ncbi:hypothetical protein DRP07_06655 [Archaeoglobales archaeon]|nr:MAG: hypothetical protein DRP07_06655 [Archaeoglobales archaeon]